MRYRRRRSHRHIRAVPRPRPWWREKRCAPKTILGRTWCASASARRNGCGLRGRVAPRERDRPPPLPPRPPVCSCSGSDRADTDPTRRRRSEEERKREGESERETERGRRSIRGGTSGTRGRNGIEVEREETINNTRGKTEKRTTGGSAGGSRKYRAVRDLLGAFTFVATFTPAFANTRGF